MNSNVIRLLAVLATCLVVLSGLISFRQYMWAPKQDGPAKKPRGVATSNKPKQAAPEPPCTIRRAAFGGTQSALLKVMKGPVVHYVVLDLPTGNPMMPYYQSDWLNATYGNAERQLVQEYPTVEDAIMRAASLCRRN